MALGFRSVLARIKNRLSIQMSATGSIRDSPAHRAFNVRAVHLVTASTASSVIRFPSVSSGVNFVQTHRFRIHYHFGAGGSSWSAFDLVLRAVAFPFDEDRFRMVERGIEKGGRKRAVVVEGIRPFLVDAVSCSQWEMFPDRFRVEGVEGHGFPLLAGARQRRLASNPIPNNLYDH